MDESMTPSSLQPTHAPVKFTESRYWMILLLVTSLFMAWGIAMTMGDVLNRHFQNILGVTKAQSGLVQFSIFGAYAVMGIPAGLFMNRFGYQKGVVLGLSLYALGAFLFIPAAGEGSFGFFRIALFVLACGLATLETVAHPFVGALGPLESTSRRMNFAQSFNGVGAVLGPLLGSYFLLKDSKTGTLEAGLQSVQHFYTLVGIAILGLMAVFIFLKVPSEVSGLSKGSEQSGNSLKAPSIASLFKIKTFRWAVIAQFFNVAAQGGTWAFFINYGVEKMGFTDERAGYFFSFSMVLMMVGRFIGTFLMKWIQPQKLLALFALANILCCLLIAQSLGWVSYAALISLNLFFSIMFPTIFSLGLREVGEAAPKASSYLVMGVVGGAFFPPLMGRIADHDIAHAYYLPILCYGVIFYFAQWVHSAKK